MKRAIVLLSGGIDSITTLVIAKSKGYDVYALSFDYGQRHIIELESARQYAARYNVRNHLVAQINLRDIGGSSLTADIAVPKDRVQISDKEEIPLTYVPARNTIFLSFALAWAESIGSEDIYIGVNAVDYSGYPDCRPEYLHAFEDMANLATRAAVTGAVTYRIHAPLLTLSKGDIIRKAAQLGIDLSTSWSCYDPQPGGGPCLRCDSCMLRAKGFREAGRDAPI